MAKAKTVVLTKWIPDGLPQPEHFTIQESPAPTPESLAEGELLVKALVMSADPYLRSRCKSEAKAGKSIPFVMSGFVAGRVLASRRDGWAAGEYFGASLPFCTVQVVGEEAFQDLAPWKLDGLSEAHISHGIGVLGMPGSTAYGGLIDVLRPEQNPAKPEVIWVSGAAGAVGSLVGQLAKQLYGCVVIGSCGGPEKGALVKERFGFDHVIDYKTCPSAQDLAAAVKACAPDGIDMYFDNVGGTHFEAAMQNLRTNGRVAICGGISRYCDGERQPERFFPTDMIYTFQRVEGFMCAPWLRGKQGRFHADMPRWLAEGKIVVEETRFEGIASWPMAFQSLFTGANTGKVVVTVANE